LQRVVPDLLLLDVDMPQLSGIELCTVVRNDVRWSTVPILFLTSQTDPETVSRVFHEGADDFIAKPIVGPELVTRIRNRLERARMFRNMLQTDTLTGVANRRSYEKALDESWDAAAASDAALAVLMIDVDLFKPYNDLMGYLQGDECLRAIAQAIVSQSRRGQDLVGRFGGEEFVMLLPDTDLHMAYEVAEQLARAHLAVRAFIGGALEVEQSFVEAHEPSVQLPQPSARLFHVSLLRYSSRP